MARRQNLSSIFAATEPAEQTAPAPTTSTTPAAPADRTVAVGVGLRLSELATLDGIAAELGVTRNNLLAYAIRRFLADHQAGRLDLARDLEPGRRLRLR